MKKPINKSEKKAHSDFRKMRKQSRGKQWTTKD